ncbi:hypothetical protein KGQ71_05040 [Patescibacteria group bacterium]|nr:hypothetical protein [Patescibacteria group bacterium]
MSKITKPSLPVIDDQEFLEDAAKFIKEGPHKEWWQENLEEYTAYKQFFQTVFVEPKELKGIFLFRATYLRSEKGRPIWREIEIAGSQTLEKLAEEIIDSMDWDNDHLHAFRLAPPGTKRSQYFRRDFAIMIDTEGNADQEHPEYLTNKVKVAQIDYEKFPVMRFEFDFGDSHEFDVEMQSVRPLGKSEKISQFPRLVDQRGVAPEQYPDWDEEEGEMSPEEADFFQRVAQDMDNLAQGIVSRHHDELPETKEGIIKMRKDLEIILRTMLKEAKSSFTLEDVKRVIYNEEGQDSLTEAIAMFDTEGLGASDLENVLEVLSDAWNYFPHKVLGGKSPKEMLLEK